jgi:hypothetical protein
MMATKDYEEMDCPRGEGYEGFLTLLFSKAQDCTPSEANPYGETFVNDVFEIHPYCWCDKEDCPQCGSGEQPNFWYKPTDLRLWWYKYPLRGANFNRKCDLAEFNDAIQACIKSLKKEA